MRLPSLLEYQRAVQVPAEAFKTVALLRTGRPILTPQGMPSVASGGFAATFKIEAASGDRYAVRCFHKQGQHDRNLPERYRHIAAFVAAHPDHEFLIDVVYQDDGITVGGNPFPTVRMQWAAGDTLGIWLEDWAEDPHRDPAAIDTVRTNIAHAVSALQQAGAAHGDLQHGNILVAPDLSIRLIDYDGMYLETFTRMPHLEAIEQGHRNYQHPGRGARYDTSIDTFSAAVIDLSLRALQHRPRLWEDYGGTGENLILGADDFCDPTNSSAFAELVSIPEIADQARRLQTACQVDYNQVGAALAGQAVTIPSATTFAVARGSDVFRAEQIEELRRLQGQTVTVFGTIQFASITKGRGGRDVALLNLGNYENGDFTIVGYDTVAESLFAAFGTTTRNHKRVLRKLHGWRVAITGMIVLYEYRGMLVPQIELVRAGLLRNLTADKIAELTKAAAAGTSTGRAAAAKRTQPPRRPSAVPPPAARPPSPTPPAPGPVSPTDRAAARAAGLHELYKHHPTAAPTPTTAASPTPSPSPAPSVTPPAAPPSAQYPPVPPRYRRESLPAPLPQALAVPPTRRHLSGWPTTPRRRRKGRKTLAGILIPAAAIVILLLIARHGAHADPVTFGNASHTVTCRITPDGDDAGIQCSTAEFTYTPPSPPPGCSDPGWGHTLALTATTVGFSCAPSATAGPDAKPLADGATTTAGPYTCTSNSDAVTCRDTRTGGHRFRLGRGVFDLG